MFLLISWGAVLVGVLTSIVLGSLWFGPLFGKKWMSLMGMNINDTEAIEKGKKEMWKLYLVQMIASVVTVSVLSVVVLQFNTFTMRETIGITLLVWIGFIVPTEIGALLWSGKTFKQMRELFLLNAGYGFILYMLLGSILALFG